MIKTIEPMLDLWDYVFFASVFVLVLAGLMFLLLVLGLPGKIALARNHPDAEAVNLMGWVGFMAIIPWINALIWAFKPTDIVDIRRYPKEEADATAAMIAKMKADAAPGRPKSFVGTKLSNPPEGVASSTGPLKGDEA
jgi:hypothetical protein